MPHPLSGKDPGKILVFLFALFDPSKHTPPIRALPPSPKRCRDAGRRRALPYRTTRRPSGFRDRRLGWRASRDEARTLMNLVPHDVVDILGID